MRSAVVIKLLPIFKEITLTSTKLIIMASGEPNYGQSTWADKVEKSITDLIAFNDLFKHTKETVEKKISTRLSKSNIQELLSCSFSPASDDRIKTWLTHIFSSL